jgi:two-component system invasion response regulator UvrY
VEKKVLIADDHAIVRSGIKFVIKDVFPFAIIHEACNGKEVILSVRKNDYDLIILDINMPGTDSIALVSHLFACKEESRVLIFSNGTGYTSLKTKENFPDLRPRGTDNPFERLSEKERLIAHYYLKGYTSTEIKKMLNLHASTIGTLKSRLFGKLKIKSLVDLVELARLYQPGISDYLK